MIYISFWWAVAFALYGLEGLILWRRFKGTKPPETRLFGYNPDEAYRFLTTLGPSGRTSYARFQLLDLLFILVGTQTMVATDRWALTRLRITGPLQLSPWLPVAYAATDIAEDLALLRLVAGFPRRQDALGTVASRITSTKFLLFGASLALSTVLGRFASRRK